MEILEIARIVFALAAVVGMIGLAAIAAKKLGLNNGAINFNRQRRLSLVEVLPLDGRRRAAIIRCDGREHFVILNPNNVTVIERSIPAAAQPATNVTPAAKSQPAAQPTLVKQAPLVKWLHTLSPSLAAGRSRRPQDELTTKLRAAGVI
jgi:flagellar protein FliO/FliZ